jgi:DNA (cytosine-5)-methyltransferase 1
MINHPRTRHLCEDVRRVKPLEATGGIPVRLLWASPDCKHFSKAKGGKPVSKKIRGLAWVVTRWARQVHPDVIILENVEEFKDWGPLKHAADPRGRKQYTKHGERVMIPDKTRRGRYFRKWVQCFRDEGYQVEWRELRACDYGGNTTRKRFFLIARRDGHPIVWPAPTHGPRLSRAQRKKLRGKFVKASPPLKPYRTAAECIDWTLPCPSIFMTREEAREFTKRTGIKCNRPLAEKTMRRIAMGLKKYVLDNPKPFIVRVDHGGNHFRGQRVDKPLSTITGHHGFGVVAPHLAQRYGEGPHQKTRGQKVDEPLRTITPDNHCGMLVAPTLVQYNSEKAGEVRGQNVDRPINSVTTENRFAVASFIAKHYGGVVGHGPQQPIGTVKPRDNHSVVAAHITKIRGESPGSDAADPMHTITSGEGSQRPAGAAHAMGLVSAFVSKICQNGSNGGRVSGADEPLRTVVSKNEDCIVAANMVKFNHGEKQWRGVDEPLYTAVAGANHHALVYSFLTKYFGQAIGQPVDEPLHTATSKPRFGVVTVTINGERYIIDDIGLRMLEPRELLAAQFTPKLSKHYKLIGPKYQQTRMIGNSVPPVLAEVLTRANVVERVVA